MTVTRRQAREWAVQMLTAADLNPPEDVEAFMLAFWQEMGDLDEEDGGIVKLVEKYRRFAEERVTGVLATKAALDEELVGKLENWDISRLGTVERAVLRMGLWEIKYTDVPKAVVINEAVDIVNWFSQPNSRQLVNAVLDKCSK